MTDAVAGLSLAIIMLVLVVNEVASGDARLLLLAVGAFVLLGVLMTAVIRESRM